MVTGYCWLQQSWKHLSTVEDHLGGPQAPFGESLALPGTGPTSLGPWLLWATRAVGGESAENPRPLERAWCSSLPDGVSISRKNIRNWCGKRIKVEEVGAGVIVQQGACLPCLQLIWVRHPKWFPSCTARSNPECRDEFPVLSLCLCPLKTQTTEWQKGIFLSF